MRKTTAMFLLSMGFASVSVLAGQDTYGPFNLQSGKVHAVGTGKTAHRSQCYEAPADRYFVQDSWNIKMISADGKNAKCYFTNFEKTPISVTLSNGIKATIPLVTRFCVSAHAETGSNTGGKTAWAECEVSAIQEEYK